MQRLNIRSDLNLAKLSVHFAKIKRGIEKESLRIEANGKIAKTDHPVALGSTLTNQYITTDYSEALPEFITPAYSDRLQPLKTLTEIHQFTYQNINDELLWGNSMPCVMGDESSIPIAKYGSSNSGRMKEVYRLGLGHRYGRFMQTIAGVHYNFSLPKEFWLALRAEEKSDKPLQEYINDKYMGLIRNYLRYSWLIPLFFGASPALCQSFIQEENIDLGAMGQGTRFGEHATSLRMSDLGYQNNAQSALSISYNNLDQYIQGLESAISTPDPYYQELGVKVNGEYQQLNANILQIENEFYSSIRPKRIVMSGERPSKALRNRGIEYIEVRALDLNPFSPIGVTQEQIDFIDAFLLACLFAESSPVNLREKGENQSNFKTVVYKGRHPNCYLSMNNQHVLLTEVADSLLKKIMPFAKLLDEQYQTKDHINIVEKLKKQLLNLDETLSGKIINELKSSQEGFYSYSLSQAVEHKSAITALNFDSAREQYYRQEAKRSLIEKSEIEKNNYLSFEDFLAEYYG